MLQEHEWQKFDLKVFHSSGEGFASWFYKVRKWIGDERPIIIPEIKLMKNRAGQLQLKEMAIVGYISKCMNVDAEFIDKMLTTDIEGLQTATVFLFASEFSISDRILLNKYPEQFCMSCFKDSLLNKKIPIFDPYWSNPWATHCVIHGATLYPVVLLDENNELKLMSFSDTTQFAIWCNRVEYAQKQIMHFNIRTPDMRVIPTGFATVAINKLFNSPTIANEAVRSLGLNTPPEDLRHQLFTVFYLLSMKHQRNSLGYELSDTGYGIWCFPTTTYFSAEVLKNLSRERLTQCIEYLACFISNPEQIYPYLIYREMSFEREEFSKYTGGDNSEIQTDPMVFLSWYIWKNFRNGFHENVGKMFPKYALEWKKKISVIEGLVAR